MRLRDHLGTSIVPQTLATTFNTRQQFLPNPADPTRLITSSTPGTNVRVHICGSSSALIIGKGFVCFWMTALFFLLVHGVNKKGSFRDQQMVRGSGWIFVLGRLEGWKAGKRTDWFAYRLFFSYIPFLSFYPHFFWGGGSSPRGDGLVIPFCWLAY